MQRLTSILNLSNEMWSRIERALLLLTFFCTAAGAIYSVRTARRALEQAEVSQRPWIAIQSVSTKFEAKRMGTQFEISNIGSIPAFVRIAVESNLGGAIGRHRNPEREELIVALLPSQTIWRNGIQIEGETFKRILNYQPVPEVKQKIRVEYGTTKNKLPFYTEQESVFKQENLARPLQDKARADLWRIAASDFK